MADRTCSVDDCGRLLEKGRSARGFCSLHYQRWRKHGTPRGDRPPRANGHAPTCAVEACGRSYAAKGFCKEHYARWRRHGDPTGGTYPAKQAPICSIDGCASPTTARGWCRRHWSRWKKWGDPTAFRQSAKGHINGQGYRSVGTDRRGLPIAEHRLVMECHLGRPLLREESVHHRNGIKHDNRLANLELWVSWGSQPYGQRVTDLIAFVVEHYPEQVAAAMA